MTGARPVEALRARLAARGHAWPAPLEHVEQLASTNDRLKEHARAGAPEWSAVWADEQTAGRGRQGHAWISPAGNLFLSVLLRPRTGVAVASLLPLMTGVAVAEALREWGVDSRLKWPNDILAGRRKLAGILVEGLSSSDGLEGAVVGIGINLVLDPRALPEDLRERVGSVLGETSRVVEPIEAAATVLARLTVWYHALVGEADGSLRIVDAWRERSVPWWGRPVEVTAGGSVLRGRAVGIDPGGALVLEREDGSRVVVVSGEARELRRLDGSH
jgi:BirA family transcriptional regulator, biotin operon repressor / biotin---[acetyl-CoA-carboxylase] ligase